MNRILIQNGYFTGNKNDKNNILKKISKEYKIEDIHDLEGEELRTFLKAVESYEFEKVYSFSIIYNCFEIEKLFQLALTNKDYLNNEEFDVISNKFEKPSVKKINENELDIKFSLKTSTKEFLEYKYPIVITFFKDLKIGIIKFNYLDGDEEKYIELCKKIENWLEIKMEIKITPHRTFPIVEEIYKKINKDSKFLKFVVQALDPNHGKIKLRMNHQDMLPLLDNLKELADTFSNTDDKEKIIIFLKDIEDTYTYLTIGLIHQTFYNTGSVHKKLTFVFLKDYLNNNGYTFVHLHSTSNLREDFENAIRDIINN